jgi:thiol-disulfide isomerase/thioredoxin
MKNIHVLPTDKPSRLFIDVDDNKLKICVPLGGEHMMNQQIYITTDEEIKEGDWVFDSTNYGLIHKVWEVTKTHFSFKDSLHARGLKSRNKNLKIHFKKIILTTDPDLIKDGVQAIDDEFLEWFVKNPTCESVVVNFNYKKFRWSELNKSQCYKITIPQEEPKQEILEEVECNNCGYLMSLTEDESVYACYNSECTSCYEEYEEKPNQEPLEEADYEKLKQLLIEFRKIPITFVPDERMYSEEDLREAFRQGKENMDYSDTYGWTSKLTEQEWFEQFKKK